MFPLTCSLLVERAKEGLTSFATLTLTSSCASCRLSFACLAVARCLLAVTVHLTHSQNRYLQYLLCDFTLIFKWWLRHRSQFRGARGFGVSFVDEDASVFIRFEPASSPPFSMLSCEWSCCSNVLIPLDCWTAGFAVVFCSSSSRYIGKLRFGAFSSQRIIFREPF